MKTLNEIYKQTATDVAALGDKGTIHNYIDGYYENALSTYRSSATRVVEVGINEGHSIGMWQEYFQNAEIIGVDIVNRNVKSTARLIYGDATKEETFADISDIDVVIDDGSHLLSHQLMTFSILFPKLKNGGIYIIEDIQDLDNTVHYFKDLHYSFEVFDLRKDKNRYDDVIIQYKKI